MGVRGRGLCNPRDRQPLFVDPQSFPDRVGVRKVSVGQFRRQDDGFRLVEAGGAPAQREAKHLEKAGVGVERVAGEGGPSIPFHQVVPRLYADGSLHPVQEAFWDTHGLQCGYCTPGMVLNSVSLLEENEDPTVTEIQERLSGNICRCTGYTKIIESVKNASAELDDD